MKRDAVSVGDLVVIAGRDGVFRVEAVLDDAPNEPALVRAFSYVDGGFVVVDVEHVEPCPPGTRAAP